MKQPIPSPEILKRYLAGQSTEAERRIVNEWYELLETGNPETIATDEAQLYQKIQASIAAQEATGDNRSILSVFWTYAIRIAAVLCMVLGFVYYFHSRQSGETAAQSPRIASAIHFQNTGKKIVRYQLPDSTLVWLSPNSKITYDSAFATRDIRFCGDAFFEVKPDKSRPFTIYSGDLKTKVLGTSFNLRALPDEATCELNVVTGLVQVESAKAGKTLLVHPREQAVFAKKSNKLEVTAQPQKAESKESWQAVSLVFDEAPMREVAGRLAEIFDVKIAFTDPAIQNCRLKVDFNNQRLPEILDMIDALLGTTYQIENQQITIRGEGCH